MNKKGITLTVLVVTIIVLLILTTSVVISGVNIRNNEKKVRFASELSYVQEMVDSYYSTYNKYPVSDPIDIYVTSIDSIELTEQFGDEILNDDHYTMYKIDFSLLSNSEVHYGNNILQNGLDYYVISKDTSKVYYANGVKIGDRQYFTLTDDLKKSINYTDKNNLNDGIVFDPSNISWSNNTIISVKVPVRYTSVKVKLNTEEKPRTSNDGAYNIYRIVVDTNSTIIVEYKRKDTDETKTTKYDVKNIDKEAPTFNFSHIKQLIDSNTGSTKKYIQIENKKDNLSGIKITKYSNSKVELNDSKDYFLNKGIEIIDDIIEINDNVEYITVYVEDNAGNYSSKYIKVNEI